MNIYIDFFSVLPQKDGVKYHGGGNYAKNIISELGKLNYREIKIIVLCPLWFKASSENEPELYNQQNLIWKNVKSILDMDDFEERSILYYPMLGWLKDLRDIVKIRRKNPTLKICATLHDVRFLHYTVDYTEKYYNSGIKKMLFPMKSFVVDYSIKKVLKRRALRDCLKSLDEIYTVSNYSMQHILAENKNTKISWYYQSVYASKTPVFTKDIPNNYILFVSGARPLKNLGHALLGFSRYKKAYPESSIKIVITGINENIFNNLCKLPHLDREIIKRETILLGYVTNHELAGLYLNCKFVLYLSKNEGFGLPILEAAAYGKTCVASNTTSIPEVIGSAVRYVCPTDDYAIAQEIAYLCNEDNRLLYEARIASAMKLMNQRMKLEQKNFIEDLIAW